MNKNPSRNKYTWLTLLICLQLCVQPLLQGQESTTKGKKEAETTPAENQTPPPKAVDSAAPQNDQDGVMEIQTPYGPMKVLKKKTGQQGSADGSQGPQNVQSPSGNAPVPSATQTPPAAGAA